MDLNNFPSPDLSWKSVKHYLATRVTTLKPPKLSKEEKKHINPIPALRTLNKKQWLFVLCGLAGWTWDSFDFFSVSLVASDIAKDLNVSVTDITWGITLVLMLRSVGAIIFGVASDRYGRKWPFIFNCVLFIVLELGTGFVQTYKQFLGVRALFGIAMGGIYGNAAATALEDCPPEARGVISGLLQEGYALGYLLCVIFTRAIADTSPYGWRALFWFGSGPPVLIIIFRFFLPETDTYIQSKQNAEALGVEKHFWLGIKTTFKTYWLMFIYLVVLMAGFNFMSHGSQDLYPTMLKVQLGFSPDRSTVTNCVANLGAIAGGVIIGHFSSVLGRRLSIMISCILGGAMIYPWAFVTGSGINAGVFFLQFFVQGAWGVIPIHLTELCPPALRSSLVGLAYQLGNLASSASSTIEAQIGTSFPIKDKNGVDRPGVYNYSLVMCIFIACVFTFVFIVTFLGPENRMAEMVAHEHVEYTKEFSDDEEKGVQETVEVVERVDTNVTK
ncbi:Carboxylic acid transporter protein-like protein [Yarrowia sp. C11]|nr:Carboxylic acid transporter protein-like protein [Yarrowia sp. E02]KAG5371719.1 Carboxylic acid transporter protein-like protein [Yarrowia sp. C11]